MKRKKRKSRLSKQNQTFLIFFLSILLLLLLDLFLITKEHDVSVDVKLSENDNVETSQGRTRRVGRFKAP